MKMWIFNWSQEHWENQFSLKNTLYVSIHDFNITDSHYNAQFAFLFRSNTTYFTHKRDIKFHWYNFWRYFFYLYWLSTGMEIRDNSITTRLFHFIWSIAHEWSRIWRWLFTFKLCPNHFLWVPDQKWNLFRGMYLTSHQGSFETENALHWYKSLSSNFVHFTLKILDYLNPQVVSHSWLQ